METKRRAWVKNAIIIFLVIMLILTFFSNTIMNYSLPEVAAQYAQSGSITSKIRTSANVKANSVYEINIDESRVVKSVAVKEGDTVAIGDVLVYLEDAESTQLQKARETLANLEKQYQLKTLVQGKDYYSDQLSITQKQNDLAKARLVLSQLSDKEASIADLEAQIDRVEDLQKELGKKISAYNKEISKVKGAAADTSLFDEATAIRIAKAKTEMEQLKAAFDAAEVIKAQTEAQLDAAEQSVKAVQEAIKAAEKDVKAAQDALTTAQEKYSEADKAYKEAVPGGNTTVDSINEQIATLNKTMKRAKEDYEVQLGKYDNQIDEAYEKYIDADFEYNMALDRYNEEQGSYAAVESARAAMNSAKASYTSISSSVGTQKAELKRSYERNLEDNNDKMAKLKAQLADFVGSEDLRNELSAKLEAADKKVEAAEETLEKRNDRVEELREALTDANTVVTDTKTLLSESETARKEAETNYDKSVDAYEALLNLEALEGYEATLEELEAQNESYTEQLADLNKQLKDVSSGAVDADTQRDKIKQLETELATLQHNYNLKLESDKLANQREQLELDELLADMDEQRELIAEYEAKSMDAKITATVAGEVDSLTVAAGQETSVGQTLCEIIVTDLGYSAEITLSVEQAQRVRVGDTVEVTNSWWSSIKGNIVSLKNDPKNPGSNRIATIALTGDVTVGQSLNLTIGERGQTYDTVIPNSAVREDNNGKFVLVVEAKSSPLGNRYIAQRYDIEVLESDDTNSAVSGLMGSEYIITTSQTPITAGNQVRLVDN